MDPSSRERGKRKNGVGNWIGIGVFVLLILVQFLQPLLQNLGSLFGPNATLQIGNTLSSWLPYAIVGLIMLSLLWSVLSAVVGGIRRIGQGSEMPSPMSGIPTASSRRVPGSTYQAPSLPGSMKLPDSWESAADARAAAERLRGVNLGQSDPMNFTYNISSVSQLPRGVHMEIPRSVNMSQISASATPNMYKTPGYEPVVDPKLIGMSIAGLVLLGVAFGFGLWLVSVLP